MSKALVVYHANCNDGFGAAWAFHTFNKTVYIEGINYKPLDYKDRDKFIEEIKIFPKGTYDVVWILDFSFSKDHLRELCNLHQHVVLIDHHKTAIEELRDWLIYRDSPPVNLTLHLDITKSGAQLTWETFNKSLKVPLIEYIGDRDLWKFALPNSKEINAVVANTDKTFEAYTILSAALIREPDVVAQVGKHLVSQFSKLVESISKEASEVIIYGVGQEKYVGLGVNCTGQFASEVGNSLANTSGTFGLTYNIDKEGKTKVSLRSVGEYDVSAIAKLFGGGGHKNAAGFSLDKSSVYMLHHTEDNFCFQTYEAIYGTMEDAG